MPEPHTLLIVVAPHASGRPGEPSCLPRRCLFDARADDVADDHFVDRGGIDAGAFDRRADCVCAERRCAQRFQFALEAADRCTNTADDENLRITHSARRTV